MREPPTPEKAHRTLRVLHAMVLAMLAAMPGVVLGVTYLRPPVDPSWDSAAPIFYLLVGLSVLILGMSWVVRARLLPRVRAPISVKGGAAVMRRAQGAILGRWMNANMMSWVLAASVGVYGALVCYLAGALWPYAVFGMPAAVVIIAMRPRLEDAERLVAALKPAE